MLETIKITSGIKPRHLGAFLCILVDTGPYPLPLVENGFTTSSGVRVSTFWFYVCCCTHKECF